jgi:MOSC domain-containing protein YiiM
MNWRGQLLHLHVAPLASAPMQSLSEARLNASVGIEGDRYATGLGTYSPKPHVDRQVTLIEVETLDALARDNAVTLTPDEHRRNLTTRGVPLNHLVGQYFRVGSCVLYGGRLNVPCIYLETVVGKKVFKPLLNRSGLNCRIVVGGLARVGDSVEWCDPSSLDAAIRRANESVPHKSAPDWSLQEPDQNAR